MLPVLSSNSRMSKLFRAVDARRSDGPLLRAKDGAGVLDDGKLLLVFEEDEFSDERGGVSAEEPGPLWVPESRLPNIMLFKAVVRVLLFSDLADLGVLSVAGFDLGVSLDELCRSVLPIANDVRSQSPAGFFGGDGGSSL